MELVLARSRGCHIDGSHLSEREVADDAEVGEHHLIGARIRFVPAKTDPDRPAGPRLDSVWDVGRSDHHFHLLHSLGARSGGNGGLRAPEKTEDPGPQEKSAEGPKGMGGAPRRPPKY